jgi:hypothetical protein
MNERDFCYWLKGFVELAGELENINPTQWNMIKDHLALVHVKETPNYKNVVSTKLIDLETPITCGIDL